MSESENYIIVVSSGKGGVKVYTLKVSREKINAFWEWHRTWTKKGEVKSGK